MPPLLDTLHAPAFASPAAASGGSGGPTVADGNFAALLTAPAGATGLAGLPVAAMLLPQVSTTDLALNPKAPELDLLSPQLAPLPSVAVELLAAAADKPSVTGTPRSERGLDALIQESDVHAPAPQSPQSPQSPPHAIVALVPTVSDLVRSLSVVAHPASLKSGQSATPAASPPIATPTLTPTPFPSAPVLVPASSMTEPLVTEMPVIPGRIPDLASTAGAPTAAAQSWEDLLQVTPGTQGPEVPVIAALPTPVDQPSPVPSARPSAMATAEPPAIPISTAPSQEQLTASEHTTRVPPLPMAATPPLTTSDALPTATPAPVPVPGPIATHSAGPSRKTAVHTTSQEPSLGLMETTNDDETIASTPWVPLQNPSEPERLPATAADKTVPSEELRIPEVALGASFVLTEQNPGTATKPLETAVAAVPADTHGAVQASGSAAEIPVPASAGALTPAPADSIDNTRFATVIATRSEANPAERMIAHQVTRAVIRQVGTGDRSLVIRLTPPELGTVRIEFRMQEGRLSANFQAEDPAVRQALERLLPQLTSDLRQADAQIQHLTVESASGTDQGFDGRGFDGRGGHQMQRHDQQGNSPRQRRSDRPLFSLEGGSTSLPAEASQPIRSRTPAGLVDTLA